MMREKEEFVNISYDKSFSQLILVITALVKCYEANLSLHFLQLLDSHEDWSVIERMIAIQKDSHWKPLDL